MSAESKSERAYRFLRERIDDGRYVPGYRLVLAQIAAELDVSVVPVREAIRRLEAEGLVTFERNVGAQVALQKEAEYLHTMQTLSLVEGFATALSAPLLTADQLARAREVNERMRRTLEDFDPHRFTELNREFHSILFEECPNPHVLDLVHRGWNRMRVLRDSSFSFVPGRARDSVAEHAHILDLIEQGADPLEIELAARRHKAATLDAVLDFQSAHRPPTRDAATAAPAPTDTDSQPGAAAFKVRAAGGMQLHLAQLIQLLEDDLVMFRVDANAGILDRDLSHPAAFGVFHGMGRDDDRAAIGCELDGVDDDLVERLLQ